MKDKALLIYNGLFVEVESNDDFWKNDTIYIYDELSDSTEKEIAAAQMWPSLFMEPHDKKRLGRGYSLQGILT